MNYKTIKITDKNYPKKLSQYLKGRAPEFIDVSGNIELLCKRPIGIFSSSKASSGDIIRAIDKANEIAREGHTVIGPFQSPLEKEFLRIIVREQTPIIIVESRTIRNMRIPKDLKDAYDSGRLLYISPYDERYKQRSREHARYRNLIAGVLADEVLIAALDEGSIVGELVGELDILKKAIKFIMAKKENNEG